MATPSSKSKGMSDFLESSYGRTTAIIGDTCIPPPIGCGGPAIEFTNPVSYKEYTISGLCQKCQDKIFGQGDEYE